MNTKQLLLLLAALFAARLAGAQGTAITYQGRLVQNGEPATGIYDLRFTLHDTLAGVATVAGPLSNPTVGVSNGLFTVTIDFGAGAFNGSPRWLQIGVRSNGIVAAHTTLTPRQSVTAAPYSVMAGNVTGNIADAQLSANVARLNGNQTFTGLPTFSPASGPPFNVSAGAVKVSNLNADLLDGLDSSAFWKLGGNAGTTPAANFLGTSDGQPIRIQTSGGVGFNTATPGAQVDISTPGGDAFPQLQLNQTSLSDYARLRFTQGGNLGRRWDMGAISNRFVLYSGYFAREFLACDANGLSLGNANNLYFGANRRQMVNLWNAEFGLGIQDFTLYQRSGDQFAWFTGGSHSNSAGDAGPGGTRQMLLNNNGELYVRQSIVVDDASLNDGASRPGLIFGSGSGEAIASVRGTNGANRWGLDFYTGFQKRLSIANNGAVGIGTSTPEDALLDIEGDTHINDHDIFLRGGSDRNHGLGYRASASGQGIDGPFVYGFNGGALGVSGPDSIALRWDYVGNVWVSNDLSVATLSIRGGADLAEPFPMAADIPKGALVVIDEEHAGALKLTDTPYDNRVAGIVSGANGVNPGLTLQQQGVLEGGQQVALTGRVYALADATSGAIKPGDLLTSSSTPGHVMRVTEHARASGTIVGKAMSALKDGKGMVLVLVNLQ